MLLSEIAMCFDLELKSRALQKHFLRNITPNVKLVQEALARGENPVGVTLLESVRDGKPGKRQASFNPPPSIMQVFLLLGGLSMSAVSEAAIDIPAEIARCFGKSATAKSIMNIFDRTVRPDVKLILETLKAGGDPEKITLAGIAKISGGSKGQASVFTQYFSPCTFS
jgi:hypothetical protein